MDNKGNIPDAVGRDYGRVIAAWEKFFGNDRPAPKFAHAVFDAMDEARTELRAEIVANLRAAAPEFYESDHAINSVADMIERGG